MHASDIPLKPSEMKSSLARDARLIVIGGGIAGTRCAQELVRLRGEERILLISAQATLLEVILHHMRKHNFLKFY